MKKKYKTSLKNCSEAELGCKYFKSVVLNRVAMAVHNKSLTDIRVYVNNIL